MEGRGGYIWFGRDSDCTNDQKGTVDQAVWDAFTLSHYAATKFAGSADTHVSQSAGFYMGPDWAQYENRISGNFRRASEFKTDKTSKSTYVPPVAYLHETVKHSHELLERLNYNHRVYDSNFFTRYITVSCRDTKNWCGRVEEGKGVGGYAWTTSGWFAYYHYITLCPLFFTADGLYVVLC
jgi:hypothetical protein